MQKTKIKKIKRQDAAIVENATSLRKLFLRVIESGDTYMVSKDSSLRSVIMPIEAYERMLHGKERRLPALAVMGARSCLKKDALRTIKAINGAGNYFSKLIFVYGKATEQYAPYFKAADLRLINNAKPHQPLITSLKLAVSALSESDEFLVFCFLSKPCRISQLKNISKAASKPRRGGEIIISKIAGKPSHPVAFSRKYYRTLITTRKELGIPRIIRKFQKDIVYVEN